MAFLFVADAAAELFLKRRNQIEGDVRWLEALRLGMSDVVGERTVGRSAWGSFWGVAVGERRCVATADLPFEFMLNALRLNEGFSVDDFEQRTGLSIDALTEPFAAARERGMLESTAAGWRASEFGRRFLNDLQAGFLA